MSQESIQHERERAPQSADITLDTTEGLTADDLIAYVTDIIADSPALFYNNAFVRLFSTGDNLGFRVVRQPADEDLFVNGRYYHDRFDTWCARLDTPVVQQDGEFRNLTDFVQDIGWDTAHPQWMKFAEDDSQYSGCNGEYGYWRIDATPDAVSATVITALDAGHSVVADISLLATLLEAPVLTQGINDPASEADTASARPTRDGHSHGGGVTDVEGEYRCPADGCSYEGDFIEVRSHIGGKCTGDDESHRNLDFRL